MFSVDIRIAWSKPAEYLFRTNLCVHMERLRSFFSTTKKGVSKKTFTTKAATQLKKVYRVQVSIPKLQHFPSDRVSQQYAKNLDQWVFAHEISNGRYKRSIVKNVANIFISRGIPDTLMDLLLRPLLFPHATKDDVRHVRCKQMISNYFKNLSKMLSTT